jgi:hypothetical protein
METIVCYISGHGFGHAVRVMEVLRAMWLRRPDLHVVIRSPLPRSIFDFTLGGPFTHSSCQLDVGVVQQDTLTVNIEATLLAYTRIAAGKTELVAGELAVLTALRPSLVLADIPALAFDIAERLGVPGIAMANFSWDWIYADYVRDFPAYESLIDGLAESYAKATLLLRLPFHGDLSAFPRVRDIPLVARPASRSRLEVRELLGLPQDGRVVLLSFGGIGLTLRNRPQTPANTSFIITEAAGRGVAPPGCRMISTQELRSAGIRYEDLVGASDAVMTKPGYGIVAECIANATPIVYTPRGRFAEYEVLVKAIESHLPNAFLSNDDLRTGQWATALDSVFTQPQPEAEVDVSGARTAADCLLQW